MPKKIVYWTSFLQPENEAISKEVFALHDHFNRSYIFGMSKYYFLKFSLSRGFLGINVFFYPIVKLLSRFIESRFEVHHIFSEINEWFLLKMVHRKPAIMTAIGGKCSLPLDHYKNIRVIVTESESQFQHLLAHGFNERRLRLIYPGIDEKKFFYKPKLASDRFQILFASTPPESKDVERRGIHILFKIAKKMPNIDIVIACRPWKSKDEIERLVKAQNLSNVILRIGNLGDINSLFGEAHATIAPFLESAKSAPLSLLESLMAGKPVIVSNLVDIHSLLKREGCAVVFDPIDEESVYAAVKELVDNYARFQANARPCAEKNFSLSDFFFNYTALYDEVLKLK